MAWSISVAEHRTTEVASLFAVGRLANVTRIHFIYNVQNHFKRKDVIPLAENEKQIYSDICCFSFALTDPPRVTTTAQPN